MISRRRFLAFCGAAVPGIWLADTGLIQLPARLVFAMSGSCSFCGKQAAEIFGLAGVTGRNARICTECIELCFDILAEELGTEPPLPQPSEATTGQRSAPSVNLGEVFNPELAQLLKRAAEGERDEALIKALTARFSDTTWVILRPSHPHSWPEPIACSFWTNTRMTSQKSSPQNPIFIFVTHALVMQADCSCVMDGGRVGNANLMR